MPAVDFGVTAAVAGPGYGNRQGGVPRLSKDKIWQIGNPDCQTPGDSYQRHQKYTPLDLRNHGLTGAIKQPGGHYESKGGLFFACSRGFGNPPCR